MMSAPRKRPDRRFVRQALLILLPLLALAALGILSLQQDRQLAHHAAAERAQALADTLLPVIWAEVRQSGGNGPAVFSVDRSGNLAWPSPVPEPDDLAPLQDAASQENPGVALFHKGLEYLRSAEPREAAKALIDVALHHPEERGETGLPLGPLAEFRLLGMEREFSFSLGTGSITLESFCSNLVHRPNLLSPFLLEKAEQLASTPAKAAEVRKWRETWKAHEHARENFYAATTRLGKLWDAPLIASVDDSTFLMRAEREGADRWFTVLRASELGPRIQAILNGQAGVPVYFGFSVELDGVRLNWLEANTAANPQASVIPHEILGSSTKNEGSVELLRVRVLLTSPAALYSHQRTRTYWFGAFIALSSGVALFGLAGAWRSFRQQERLNTMKSNFVSSVSHELRAPIASVRLMAENLERGKIPDEARRMEYFRFISQECRRLSSLVENVLDFSRIEQGRKQYEFEPCDISAIIRSTLQLMEPAASERGVTLSHVPSAPPVPSICVDGKALQQALVNLVDNAIKHSPRGSTITIGLEIPSSNGRLLLWVEDQGEGIPAIEHEKIFDRFYRLGSELRRETQGVGIGLSIVKHVVEAHRGRIHVRSAPGQGSRFTIELPREGKAL